MQTEIIINQNTIHFSKEKFIDIYMECSPSFHEHATEINPYNEPLQLDYSGYMAAEEEDRYVCYTARLNKKVIGYSSYSIYSHPQHALMRVASQDTFYLKPAFRGNGYGDKFMSYCETQVMKTGAKFIQQSVAPCYDWSSLLKKKGYKELETIYFKKL